MTHIAVQEHDDGTIEVAVAALPVLTRAEAIALRDCLAAVLGGSHGCKIDVDPNPEPVEAPVRFFDYGLPDES